MSSSVRRILLPVFLVACVLLVAFWETRARISRGPREAFELTTADFEGFKPRRGEWWVQASATVSDDETAPTVLAYALASRDRPWVIVRLTHGYNMPDCMRLKQHDVELLEEKRDPRLQVWRLFARDTDDLSVWATAMISADDFSGTDIDTRAMPFPRVASVDDPDWTPNGITRDSLKNPIRNLKRFFRHRWNSSRSDLATFLRLKKPAWGSQEMLILVVHAYVPERGNELESDPFALTRQTVLDAHAFILAELRDWQGKKGG
tara:strand:- start:684 stop:1472 length:789 start_codon:yes stop_codon:yes gene_type:complete